MTDIKTIEGDFTGGKGNYTIVVGRWNSFVVEHLLEGAIDCLRRHGVSKSQITIVRAPGAFEIPVAVRALLDLEQPTCVIALGVLIRGETQHADLVATSVTDTLQRMAVESRTPIINEVLLLDNEEQAKLRCLDEDRNRGIEAARAAAAMVEVFGELDRGGNLRMHPSNV